MYTDIEMLYNDADKLLQAKDLISDWEYIKAKYIIEEVLDEDPLNEMGHYLLAHIFDYHYGEYEKAMLHYEVAIRTRPNFYEAIAALLRLYNKCMLSGKTLELGLSVKGKPSAFSESIDLDLALAYERQLLFAEAMVIFEELKMNTTNDDLIEEVNASMRRVKKKIEKVQSKEKAIYTNFKFSDDVNIA